MASIISWQFIAWPLSPSTRAAASSALSFLGCSAAGEGFGPFSALVAFLLEALDWFLFLAAMMRLLREVSQIWAPRRRPNRTGLLPRRAKPVQANSQQLSERFSARTLWAGAGPRGVSQPSNTGCRSRPRLVQS